MKLNAFTIALLSAGLAVTAPVSAAWQSLSDGVDSTTSRATIDRVNRVYSAVVTLTNTSQDTIDGPFRILITNSSIEVNGADGYTGEGIPYVDVNAESLAGGERIAVSVSFNLERKRLSFTPVLQQDNPNIGVYAEAEGGGDATLNYLGMDLTIDTGAPGYVTTLMNATVPPEDDSRVAELLVNFNQAGTYALYARVRVGPGGFSDDSMYIPSALGNNNEWILVNGITGYAAPGEEGYEPDTVVDSGGEANLEAFMWVAITDGEYTVANNNTTEVFRYASREDGLDIDKFVFAPAELAYTVEQLEEGLPGQVVTPGETYTPSGPPLADGKSKFLGSVCCGAQRPNFEAYWNQVTAENAGKWGSVEAVRDQYNWTGLDEAYNLAKDNGFVYKHHVLVWGSQQPGWIDTLTPAEQLDEILEWYQAVNQRYPAIDFIEVVNEFDNAPPDGSNGRPDYVDGLRLYDPAVTAEVEGFFLARGDDAVTAAQKAEDYDWIVNAFQMARDIFPASTQLMFNEYSVINSDARTDKVIDLANLLQSKGLIDAIGFQGHAFSTGGPLETMVNNIDRMDSQTGLDIYLTELDIDGADELTQLLEYQRLFPAFWTHPAVEGITMWGYLPGHWREEQGAILAYETGVEKSALKWLKGYVRELAPQFNQPSLITVDETSAVGTQVADLVSYDYQGSPHDQSSAVQWSVLSGNDNGLFAVDAQSGKISVAAPLSPGLYDLYIQVVEGEYPSFTRQVQIVVPGDDLPPEVIEYDFTDGTQGWRGDYGTTATVGYDESIPAALLVPDWPSRNAQEYIEEISMTDLNGANLSYTVNVTQGQVDGGMTIQPYVQTGGPTYSRIYGAAIVPVAGENVITFAPEDNSAGDLAIIERLGLQLNGPLTEGTDDVVEMTYVRLEIPTSLPSAETVTYDFISDSEGMRGDYGTNASVIHRPAQEAVSLQPNDSSETHNYILGVPSRDYAGAAITYTLNVSSDLAASGLSVQGYVQTGAPNYARIYGSLEPLSAGSNLFTFYPQDDGSGNIENIERIALQVNGAFVADEDSEILIERIDADFP
ncbi:endo-1,4-beta-xylanase [uncultured Alteromonas sp.]|jgi:endo-1,4-beta-xylanase|uniref:endo-1,4-beta-xylanase n=1 Tax=uncultured Alteromonas sp. TaxID=179113 RepID=UPI0025E53088|nr:endo-1,4-beta-xylanase [uncultured Alteromonas sp.]